MRLALGVIGVEGEWDGDGNGWMFYIYKDGLIWIYTVERSNVFKSLQGRVATKNLQDSGRSGSWLWGGRYQVI